MINPKYNKLAVGVVFIALLTAMGFLSYKLIVKQSNQVMELRINCDQN